MLIAFNADSVANTIMPATNDHWDSARGFSNRTANARPPQKMASRKLSVDAKITVAKFQLSQIAAGQISNTDCRNEKCSRTAEVAV